MSAFVDPGASVVFPNTRSPSGCSYEKEILIFDATVILLLALSAAGCGRAHGDLGAEAPPPAKVISDANVNRIEVEHPEQFPLTAAVVRTTTSKLVVTGTVTADILRSVPVASLASGRIVAIHARLGDTVKKGQALLEVQSSDAAGAFSDFRKAVNDERLARVQYERAKILYDKGAISKSSLEALEHAEQNAQVVLETAAEHLHLLGLDKNHPQGIILEELSPNGGHQWRRCSLAPLQELVHEALPRFLGELVEEPHPLGGIDGVNDGTNVFEWPAVQQHVLVVIRKLTHDNSGQIHRQGAKNSLLIFVRSFRKNICCSGRT